MIFIISVIFFLTSFSIHGKDFYIKKIEFHGLKNYTPNELFSITTAYTKRSYDDQLLITLAKLHIFDHLHLKVKNNTIKISTHEKPIIKNIVIYSQDKDIVNLFLDYNDITNNTAFDRHKLELFKYDIKTYCEESGFHNFNLNIKLILNQVSNELDIKINFLKKNTTKIKDFLIYGNKIFPSNQLKYISKINKTSWRSWIDKTGIYAEDKFTSAIKKLQDFYFDHGYVDYHIKSVKLLFDERKNFIYIFINIYEGTKYKILKILIKPQIKKKLHYDISKVARSYLSKDNFFSQRRITALQEYMTSYFHGHGFINVAITHDVIHVGHGFVNIVFNYKKPIRPIVSRLSFIGNTKLNAFTLRTFSKQLENNMGFGKKFELMKQDLIKRNYAAEITFKTTPLTPKKDKVDFLVTIKEKKINKFSIGLSYSRTNGLGCNVNGDLFNALGSGHDIVGKITKNDKLKEFNITYNAIRFFEHEHTVSYNIYHKTENIDKHEHAHHILQSFGFTLTHTFTMSKRGKLDLILGGERTLAKFTIDKADPIIKQFFNKVGYKYKEYHVGAAFTYDSLDQTPNPNQGINSKIKFKITVPPSNIQYYTISYDFLAFKKLLKTCLLSFYFNLEYGNKFNDEFVDFPFFKHFFLHGRNNVRGYKDKNLGPKDSKNQSIGGNLLILFKMCFHFQFPGLEVKHFFKPYFFFDAGQVYHTDTNFSNKPTMMHKGYEFNAFLRMSVGLSVHWGTPLGVPIEFTFAYPINPDMMDKREYVTIVLHSDKPIRR